MKQWTLGIVAAYCMGAGLLVLTGLASTARADKAKDEELEKARDHMEQGQEFYVQGRFLEAAQEFERAFELQKFGAFMYNAAVAYERHGDLPKASEYFKRYLAQDPQARDAENTKKRIEELDDKIKASGKAQPGQETAAPTGAAVTAPPPVPTALPTEFKSLLSVRTNPEGAEVSIHKDNTVFEQGISPLTQTLEEGQYKLVIHHPKYRTVEESVSIKPGKVYVIIVEMSQGKFLGYLRVVTQVPGAGVYIDRKEQGAVGKTPFHAPLPTGKHKVWIDKPGYKPVEREVQISVSEDVLLQENLERVDYGRIRVRANITNAQVYVNDVLVEDAPMEKDYKPGRYSVRVESDGYKDWESQVTVEAGQVTPVDVRMQHSVDRTSAWVTAAVAAVALGGGLYLGKTANDIEDDLRREQAAASVDPDDSRMLEGGIYAAGADVAFGVAGLFAAISIYNFIRDAGPDSDANIESPKDWALAPIMYEKAGGGGMLRCNF